MKTASFFTYQGPGAISIARYAPRGKNHLPRCDCLAPTHAMLKMDEATYRALYFENILGRLNAEQLWEDLHRLSYPHEPVLLCWERPPLTARNWCHRRMIAEFCSSELGQEVQEIRLRFGRFLTFSTTGTKSQPTSATSQPRPLQPTRGHNHE